MAKYKQWPGITPQRGDVDRLRNLHRRLRQRGDHPGGREWRRMIAFDYAVARGWVKEEDTAND